MKNNIFYILSLVLSSIFLASCEKIATNELISNQADSSSSSTAAIQRNGCSEQAIPWFGYCFENISHDESEMLGDLQLVNKTNGVEALAENIDGVIAEHWRYKSPSFAGRNIGFSVVYTNTENASLGSMDVVLFLHGNGGDENSGAGSFFDQYQQNHSDKAVAFIFANGISRVTNPDGDTGFSWQENKQSNTGLMIDHTQLNLELIAGIINNDALFPLMSKNLSDWKTFGFSVGASAALAMYLDPTFQTNTSFQPEQIFCFGGWMSNSLPGYFDILTGLSQIEECDTDPKLIFGHHVNDNGNGCSVNSTVEVFRSTLEPKLVENDVAYIHLELSSPPAGACDPVTGNPAHNVKFYLNHRKASTTPDNIFVNASCDYDVDNFSNLFHIVSELLYD